MSNINLYQNLKKIPSDCIICAIRPLLYLNRINICNATFSCYHTEPSLRPHFKTSKIFGFISILCMFLLGMGILNDILSVNEKLSNKHIIILVETIFSASTIALNAICLLNQDLKIKELHGLMSLMNHKLLYGITVILTSTSAKKVHDILFYAICCLLLEELLTFCHVLIVEQIDFHLSIRMVTIEILVFCNASLGFFAFESLELYRMLFDRCFMNIESCFKDLEEMQNKLVIVDKEGQLRCEKLAGTMLLEKLRLLQRLYMSLNRNFNLIEKFIQPGLLLIYNINVCLLLIGYCYFGVMLIQAEVSFFQFDYFITVKSGAIVLGFTAFCFEAQRVLSVSENILSFLFKCPISKLSFKEAAQIEAMIATLSTRKPGLQGSDASTVGTALLASVSGIVVTYVLVALQFHETWGKKNGGSSS